MKIGGIDVGTTGCKITVYNEKGEFLNKEYVAYEVSRNTGEHEIDGQVIWNGVKKLIKESAAKVGNIDSIGITSFGESFVMLDKDDNVLMPSMLYTDSRGSAQAEELDENLVMNISGVKPHSMYSLPKIMWIKKNKPEIYKKADKILLFEDYIIYMLTGVNQIDYSLAARTMGLDIIKLKWSSELFEIADVDMSKMSKPVPSGTIAGNVRKELEEELGLSNTVIVNGCHDQVASAMGAGAFEAGTAVDGCGTVECVTPVFDKIPDDKNIYENCYSVVPYAQKGKYVCYALSYTGGAAVKWFKDNFSKDSSYKELDDEIDLAPGKILIMPHFAGAANPFMDSGSKAAFLGVTLETTKMDIYKAILEGVAYEMLVNLKCLEKSGIKPERLYATGGGANSSKWLQIKANILNIPITAIDLPEVGAVGTIMLAGVATGVFKDVEEAKKIMIKEGKTYFPDASKNAEYKKLYKNYERIYNAVRPLV